MGNYLSLAAVTATLQDKLQAAVSPDISDCRVHTEHPEKAFIGAMRMPGINLFLYQVTPNTFRRNEDLPTRIDQTLTHYPRVTLDLFYLISFYGNQEELVPQRLFGLAAANLQAFPYFDPRLIEQTIASRPFLEGSDLASQAKDLGLTQISISSEDITQIWSGFFHNVPYALSMIYKVSSVVIHASVKPKIAKAVKEVRI